MSCGSKNDGFDPAEAARLWRRHHDLDITRIMQGDHDSAWRTLRLAVQLHDGPYLRLGLDVPMKAGACVAKV